MSKYSNKLIHRINVGKKLFQLHIVIMHMFILRNVRQSNIFLIVKMSLFKRFKYFLRAPTFSVLVPIVTELGCQRTILGYV